MLHRKLILLVFFLAPLVAVSQELFNDADSSTVSGKIEGYSIKQGQQTIHYYVYDIAGEREKFSVPIDKDGKFKFKFKQLYEGEFSVQYGANEAKLYAKPGEKVDIKIDHNVVDKVYHFPEAYKIDGPSAAVSTHILKFFAQYLPVFDERLAGMNKLSTDVYVKLAQQHLEYDLGLLNNYVSKHHPPEIFNVWMKNYLKYETASLIISKPFLSNDTKGLNSSRLLDLLKTIEIRNESALHNASYYTFLAKWVEVIHLVLENELGRSEFTTAVTETLKNLDKNFDGITREITYYHSYLWNASSELAVFRLEQVWEQFDSVITNNVIQELLETKRSSMLQVFVPYSVAGRIRELSIDTLTRRNLLSVLEKEKGHFVFVNFWGTWCAPCMAEMPQARSFIEQFKGQPINFLFLSVKTSLHETKSVQQKYAIPGTFIALNGNETAIVNQVFGFSTYPSSFIIDPGGNLVTKNIRILNPKDAADLIWMMLKKQRAEN